MIRRHRFFGLVAVFALSLTAIAYFTVQAMIKVDGREGGQYYCEHAHTDPYCACMSAIGDEEWCSGRRDDTDSGGDHVSWGTGCHEEGGREVCTAWTNCADGSQVNCIGEFQAFADEAGVRCKDTGDAIASSDYCP